MDLNVCIESHGIRDPDDVIREKLKRCRQLGFNTVALSVYLDITHLSDKSKQQLSIPAPPDPNVIAHPGLRVYTRLTVKVSETIQLFKLHKCAETSKYNLLALEPQNNKLFQYLTTGSSDLDILTFNLSERLDYNLFKAKFKLLQKKDVCFEINYGPAQLGSTLRRNVICNGQNLVEKISKNLIISSGVQDIFRLRGPKDAESLGVLFMLPFKKCHETVFKNGQKALESAKHRINQISTAIELIED
jgi:ribonuclease P/MRP protein subunit RPP1